MYDNTCMMYYNAHMYFITYVTTFFVYVYIDLAFVFLCIKWTVWMLWSSTADQKKNDTGYLKIQL
jgi:hypothetical protein